MKAKTIVNIYGYAFAYDSERKRYITTVDRDGNYAFRESRTLSLIWGIYSEGISRFLLQLATKISVGGIPTGEIKALKYKCVWDTAQNEYIFFRSGSGSSQCSSPLTMLSLFYLAFSSELDRRISEKR